MKLRALLEQASIDLTKDERPNMDAVQTQLFRVLSALGYKDHNEDKLETIEEYNGMFQITTSWSSQNSLIRRSSYSVPSSIIDAEDPMHAAANWKFSQRVADATNAVNVARVTFIRAEADLRKALDEFNAFMTPVLTR